MQDYQITQQAYSIIREMASLSSTPGIDVDTQKQANEVIQTLIIKVIKPSLEQLTATASGIILKR